MAHAIALSPVSRRPASASSPLSWLATLTHTGSAEGAPAAEPPPPAEPVVSERPSPNPRATLAEEHAATAQDSTDVSDESLMDAYCAGDIQAFNQLFTRFTDRLVRFLTSMVGREKAKDLTQLTFMKIHENRHRYQSGKSVAAWFFAIARNNALDYVRSAPKRREVFGLEVEQGKDAPSFDRLRDAQVRDALAKLTEDQQKVIQLHWFADLTFDEVAQAVGASPAAVRVRAHRGYEKLRGLLAELHAEVTS